MWLFVQLCKSSTSSVRGSESETGRRGSLYTRYDLSPRNAKKEARQKAGRNLVADLGRQQCYSVQVRVTNGPSVSATLVDSVVLVYEVVRTLCRQMDPIPCRTATLVLRST